ncbi:MAG: battenin CLN3 protein [Sarcosagium campestre]|nr:MAG: battenin CLN3 protein [Sarcosagium campestre]
MIFRGTGFRTCTAFWLFGLINNVLYVIILTAALDLVGPNVPKGAVLLADVLPSFVTKLIAPYFIQNVPYPARVATFFTLSTCGMLLVALSPDTTAGSAIASKMAGVVLASVSSGGGELSFLSLTHYYGHSSLAAWASGTGAAGLVGAGAYVLATTILQWSVKSTLLAFSFLPLIMLASFFLVLPHANMHSLTRSGKKPVKYETLPRDDPESSSPIVSADGIQTPDEEEGLLQQSQQQRTAAPPKIQAPRRPGGAASRSISSTLKTAFIEFESNLVRVRGLFFPYMLPLLLVYVSEYTINQGVAPTLLFPLSSPSTPFKYYRSFYPTYNAIYQVGVFIARSSTPWIRFHALYPPSILQCVNLVLLALHAVFNFIPNVYFVFGVVFWEGLLGGLVYVNTFAEITDRVEIEDREFSLGATSVSDSAGVCIAGFLSMAVEVWLCKWQVRHGRDYCQRV